ncbi:hypothetical protein [Calditerricola satsumensis]|uniref:hypothetical protein n=1 Tax=Calditerricola satsumensis TaxID=373054 RepID=UPI0006D11DDC|nr:hypothetical protein [Calditerricola satsumensis]
MGGKIFRHAILFFLVFFALSVWGFFAGHDLLSIPIEKRIDKFRRSMFLPLIIASATSYWLLSGKIKKYSKYIFCYMLICLLFLIPYIIIALFVSQIPIESVLLYIPSLITLILAASFFSLTFELNPNAKALWEQKEYYIATGSAFLIAIALGIFSEIYSKEFLPLTLFIASIILLVTSIWEFAVTMKK